MRGKRSMALISGLSALIMATAPLASANDADVIREGRCSGRSDWKLKLSPEDGRIEVEYEVDQNRVGDTWKIRLKHDGKRFFRGTRTTTGPSGSFEVRRVERNHRGKDGFRARAINLRTDQVCRGRARF
ncbi:MAG: hypothetical protein H0W21_08895 [Actinobacteria bacterium]|nr:hypothetical protein [Actinomycetota bacterium]